MSHRIAVGGFLHETHSFAPRPTTYQDFRQPGGFPPLQHNGGLLDALRGRSIPIAGAIEVLEAVHAELVPLAWCFASPAGPIEDEAFERIAALIGAHLSLALDQGPLDGIYLDLHGAALTVSHGDAEGELLRRVRAIVGADLPLTISLDPHANLTRAMVERADAVVPFRTYPHVDMPAAGAQAARLLLERIARRRPWAKAYRQLDFWMPIGSQCTLMEPMQSVMAERAARAAEPGIAELAFCFGFPYADFPDCGGAVAVFADTEAEADRAAQDFAAYVTAREGEFVQETLEAAEAVAEAKRLARDGGPVVIADTQDNPGGGGHGDTTGLLAELVRQKAEGAFLCLINDAESAAACHQAGEGAIVPLSLGGKSDGMPLPCSARVLRLTDGRFTLTGPMGAGNPGNTGPTALIDIEGVRVMVTSRKVQALDQAIIRHVGVEPAECPIIALKSSVHFRADFGPIASRILVAIAPGPVVADPAQFNFRHVRAGVRRRPAAR
ncbi:MAG TPA: M81 family metallopeptidase [Acetobacteraceae bacterium]|nr:M81 family metallopeptidase [Acetobacteraceae bacterium]